MNRLFLKNARKGIRLFVKSRIYPRKVGSFGIHTGGNVKISDVPLKEVEIIQAKGMIITKEPRIRNRYFAPFHIIRLVFPVISSIPPLLADIIYPDKLKLQQGQDQNNQRQNHSLRACIPHLEIRKRILI